MAAARLSEGRRRDDSVRRPSWWGGRLPWLALLAVGSLLLASGWALRPPSPQPGTVAAAAPFVIPTSTPASPTLTSPTPAPTTLVTPTTTTPTVPAASTSPAPVAPPSSIALGASGDPVRVVPIGVSPSGVLEPPADGALAGWWVAGPRPGGAGRTVITGHVDTRAGLGAFAALDLLYTGDPVTVTSADGVRRSYVVTTRQEVRKSALDPAVLTESAGSDLMLVTCIGVFDRATASYESNLLITATPVLP